MSPTAPRLTNGPEISYNNINNNTNAANNTVNTSDPRQRQHRICNTHNNTDTNQNSDKSSSTPAKSAEWQQDLINRLAMSSLKEQRAARRWGIFFKLLMFAYLVTTWLGAVTVHRMGKIFPAALLGSGKPKAYQ